MEVWVGYNNPELLGDFTLTSLAFAEVPVQAFLTIAYTNANWMNGKGIDLKDMELGSGEWTEYYSDVYNFSNQTWSSDEVAYI